MHKLNSFFLTVGTSKYVILLGSLGWHHSANYFSWIKKSLFRLGNIIMASNQGTYKEKPKANENKTEYDVQY